MSEHAAHDVQALRDALAGEVVTASESGWDAARQAWNLTADQRPAPSARRPAGHGRRRRRRRALRAGEGAFAGSLMWPIERAGELVHAYRE